MTTAVTVSHLQKDYHLGKTTVHALKGIDCTIGSGDFVTVAGPSGSGKSTLLSIIGCLESPTGGEVWLGDVPVSAMRESQLNRVRLETIGFVFQAFNLLPVLDVFENVELPLLIRRDISAHERRDRVRHYIEAVGLGNQVRQKPAELSGGQRQRVAIARALVTHPAIVLADEPTANLDSATAVEIIDLMHEVNRREATTFIFSSHDSRIIQRANRVLTLEDGHLLAEGAL